MTSLSNSVKCALGFVSLVAILSIALSAYLYTHYSHLLADTESTLASTTSRSIADLRERDEALVLFKSQNEALTNSLATEHARNSSFGAEVAKISSTVSTLTKLSQMDPQLLAKYSKVYFLNENYIPAHLSEISPTLTTQTERSYNFESNALPFLTRMLNDASSSNIHMQVASAYRSFGSQASLKNSYRVRYGTTAANSFSADQGYSEHQLGTAVDFSTPSLAGALAGFDTDPAFSWLNAHAYEYGFILSYPAHNAFYVYEPWHWRFVGTALARNLHETHRNFYDLDQREINTYLISLFDN